MKLLILLLLCAGLVTATDYTLYSGNTVTVGGSDITVTLFSKNHPDLDAAVSAYKSAKEKNITALINEAYNETLDALSDAKREDVLYAKVAERTIIIPYKECKRINEYNVCFNAVTYYEEDVSPLGDGRLDTVKIENGTTLLPFTLSVTEAVVQLEVTRTLNATNVFPNAKVGVKLSVINKGIEDALGVTATDEPPFNPTSGKATGYDAKLEQFDQLLLNYVVTPTKPGTYTFAGSVTASNGETIVVPTSTLIVSSPVSITISASDAYVGDVVPVTVNITNTFGKELTLTNLEISGTESYQLSTEKSAYNPRQSFSDVTLANGASHVATIGYTGSAAGSQTVVVVADYTAEGKGSVSAEQSYQRREPTLVLNAQFGGLQSAVTVRNDGPTSVEGVRVVFSDGFTKSIATLRAGAEATVQHAFTVTEPTAAWVEVSADAQNGRKAFLQRQEGAVQPDGSVPSTPTESPTLPEQPTTTEQPTTQPAETPPVTTPGLEPATAGSDDEGFIESVINGFVGFLERIFG